MKTTRNKTGKTKWVTHTAIFIALLVVVQTAGAALGGTMVTGSAVNAALILAVLLEGPGTGLCTAVLSPVLARLLGIGPLWSLIPCIILGNVALVACWHRIAGRSTAPRPGTKLLAMAVAALAKFGVLYFGVVCLVLPLLHLPKPQAAAIGAMFSAAQLFTALAGGALALLLLPLLKRAK